MRVARHVDQNVAQAAIDQPRRHALTIQLAVVGDFTQGNFEFIDLIVAGFVNARCLAGGPNEHATEQIAQAGMVVPIQQ